MNLREVIVLHYVADLPVAQIARECGISSGTVKSRLVAGRPGLRRRWKRWLELDDTEVRRRLVSYSDQFRATAAPPAKTIRRRMRRRRIRLAAVTGGAATMLTAGAVFAVAAILPAAHLARPSAVQHRAAPSPLGWVPAGPQLPANSSPQAWPFVVWLPARGTTTACTPT